MGVGFDSSPSLPNYLHVEQPSRLEGGNDSWQSGAGLGYSPQLMLDQGTEASPAHPRAVIRHQERNSSHYFLQPHLLEKLVPL